MHSPIVRAATASAWLLALATQLIAQTAAPLTPLTPMRPAVVEPQPAPPPPVPPADDHASILRFDPFENKLVPVAADEVKPGFLYNHFHARLNRRVWSVAVEGGGFDYAMGEGSTEPARMLDLRGTEQQQRSTLERTAPGLVEMLRQRGGVVYLRLNATQGWELVPYKTVASVWDLQTLERFEWHGSRRVPVIHTFGNSWIRVDGRFEPAPMSAYAYFPCGPL
jgi:hypothetical protein